MQVPLAIDIDFYIIIQQQLMLNYDDDFKLTSTINHNTYIVKKMKKN